MTEILRMTVNGSPVELGVDARECLTDVLRERLGLTSVKKGCEVGECGACTVLINGEAINSCLYLALWAEGKEILTVEGLSTGNTLTPIQQIFVDEAATQCGFCTPGIILTAVELLGRGQPLTRAEIRREISGHLCRCTGYENIVRAVARVLAELSAGDAV